MAVLSEILNLSELGHCISRHKPDKMNLRQPWSVLGPYELRGPADTGGRWFDTCEPSTSRVDKNVSINNHVWIVWVNSLYSWFIWLVWNETNTSTHTHAHMSFDCMQCNQYYEPIFYSIQLNDYWISLSPSHPVTLCLVEQLYGCQSVLKKVLYCNEAFGLLTKIQFQWK